MAHTYFKKPKVKQNRRKRKKAEKRVSTAKKREASGKVYRAVNSVSENKEGEEASFFKKKLGKNTVAIAGVLLVIGFMLARVFRHL